MGDEKAAIAGVNEGVEGMRVGGVRRILIPPSLAYVQGLEDDKVLYFAKGRRLSLLSV